MEDWKTRGLALRQARKANQMTMGDLARALERSVAYVSDMELGRSDPREGEVFLGLVPHPAAAEK